MNGGQIVYTGKCLHRKVCHQQTANAKTNVRDLCRHLHELFHAESYFSFFFFLLVNRSLPSFLTCRIVYILNFVNKASFLW